jgi:hypothetical protein
MKLSQIAAKIDAHLRRFEMDPKINNRRNETKLLSYYGAGASVAGRYVSVQYIGYQGDTSLSKAEAERYLAWLDAGNVGRHWQME